MTRAGRLAGVLVLLAALLPACAPLPTLEGRSVSSVLQDTEDTALGRSVVPLVRAHPGLSGIVPLSRGGDAFAARALLAQVAERSLDVQYYIWRNDLSGQLLFDALRRAADRGVRVRLLLDDNGTEGLDGVLAALDAHPNVEVRLFNPFSHRRPRLLEYVLDFSRLNRRMHNKSFTADNQVTLIGGRNIGDEYFDLAENTLFIDLDVMAVGPVVQAVSADFDAYWASASSYPADRLLPPVDAAQATALTASAARAARDPAAQRYFRALATSPFVGQLLERKLAFEWDETVMLSDDPAKGLGRGAPERLLFPRLKQLVGDPKSELLLVTPYFVPGTMGVANLADLVKRGVKVTVLTNALEATDVAIVHAGYAKHRKALLEAGVRVFELKRAAAAPTLRGFTGSSASSLHAKTFSVDQRRIFIGSFNFDPRSARTNTEMGFLITSPTLARAMAQAFAQRVPQLAYEVKLAEDGKLRWVEQGPAGPRVHQDEPGAGLWLRLGVSVLSVLPIEWLL